MWVQFVFRVWWHSGQTPRLESIRYPSRKAIRKQEEEEKRWEWRGGEGIFCTHTKGAVEEKEKEYYIHILKELLRDKHEGRLWLGNCITLPNIFVNFHNLIEVYSAHWWSRGQFMSFFVFFKLLAMTSSSVFFSVFFFFCFGLTISCVICIHCSLLRICTCTSPSRNMTLVKLI